MFFYHVYVEYKDKKGKQCQDFVYNDSEEHIRKSIATRYMENKSIMLIGRFVHPSDIERIDIFKSEKEFGELTLPNGKSPAEIDNTAYIYKCFLRRKMKGKLEACTQDFITSTPEEKEKPRKITTRLHGKKDKVFIVHGRDIVHALQLQKHLKDKLKVDAVMFDDLPDKGRIIIEQLEFIKSNVSYAFVIVTPDDVGCLVEDMDKMAIMALFGKKKVPAKDVRAILDTLNTRARQNVVFELGLFIGALSRNKVCCLLQEDLDEKPSDIDGILYKPFKKSVTEIFHEIEDELKEEEK